MKTHYKGYDINFEKENEYWCGSTWVTPNALCCGYGFSIPEMLDDVLLSVKEWESF